MTATETALAELMGGDLSGLDLVALMVDGVHFAGRDILTSRPSPPGLAGSLRRRSNWALALYHLRP